jgi:A/G-specific adenine glycosylase
MAYYLKFASNFPSVKHLAKADSDKVMKLWQGLGYYSRARNLHETSQIITGKYNGKFPDVYEDILSLKGVGEYTAAAIASFAFNKPHAVVDGNVYRVLSRVFGIETPIDSAKGKKEFYQLANELIDKKNPGLFNQAIMELGAIQCKPVHPDCSLCTLNAMCFAFKKKRIAELPVKEKKTKVRNRFFYYIIFDYKGKTLINKRTGKDIWNNLYEFPLIETANELSETQFFGSEEWQKFIRGKSYTITSVSPIYKHILSHQKIFARFVEINCKSSFRELILDTAIIINKKDIHKYAVPRLVDNYLEKRKEEK